MPKKRPTPTIYKKSLQKQWKQQIADDIYDAQIEDLEHLLEKKKRLKRKELFTNGTSGRHNTSS
jgi:inhibitor of KinA sporulation pathway (predicted exonuclease)